MIICTFTRDELTVFTKDNGHLITFRHWYRVKTVWQFQSMISVSDFCRIVSNWVRFHCCVNHRVFNIFLRWNTLNATDIFAAKLQQWQSFTKSFYKCSTNENNTASKKNNLPRIASNLWWNITALKAEISHLLLSVLFVVDRNKTGKP